ncbi:curli production assembly/transport component CsgF, partial [Escherichia coli FRIK1990]
SIFSHPVYLFLREFSLQDFRGGSDPSYNDDFGIETPSALDNFTQAIQSQILGGLLSNINTGKPGRMVTNDYIVDIANRDGQLQLNVTDRKTGQTSTIQVSGLQNNSTDF